MKNTQFLAVITITVLSFTSCTFSKKEVPVITQEEEPNSSFNHIGKTFEYDYGEFVYEVIFKSENQLHWHQIKGTKPGAEADETYYTHRLNNHTLFIAWIEEDGLGVTQVIDLKEMVVRTFVRFGDKTIPTKGTLKQL